ncbi:hypothetical protein BDZ94DRAFT_1253169 [Collybia nuda]|uniref:Uncharacterized protein n=1 Tax=Collybia nuda TaxID=64659 RepID=A0A9P6CH35_9AGAR|nr:hypothetical protein BDZ94DRAFT_1253169 [Collybia nuda]
MYSNIEQAVADVVALRQEVILSNVLTAYIRVAGFSDWSADALIAFERALDKHPDSGERLEFVSVELVAELRQSYWYQMLGGVEGGEAKCSSCPCCGIMALVDQMVGSHRYAEEITQITEYAPVKPKKPKTGRTKKRRLMRKAIAFDPYGPSTSASSM